MFDARFFRWYFFLLLFWVVFQISFLNILLPDIRVPIATLASVVTVATLLPLTQALGWSLVVAVLFDILRFGFLTPFVFAVVPLVLVTSYLTKRFSADTRSVFQPRALLFFLLLVLLSESLLLAAWPTVQEVLVACVLFPLVFFSLHRMQDWLVASSLVEFRGVR